MNKVIVKSEIGRLKKVIVHRPDNGIAMVTPKRAEELLFDDIVDLFLMQREHDTFTEVLAAFCGKENVVDTHQLLFESLMANTEYFDEFLRIIIKFEELPDSYIDYFRSMEFDRLTEVLITGFDKETDTVFFDPIPNFIFTRDIAVSVNDHLIITRAAKQARQRENILTRFIFRAHPDFQYLKNEKKLINLNDREQFPPSKSGERVSIEGGDIMIFEESHLLIGVSERTTEHAFHSIKNYLFEKGIIENVVQVNMPNDRSYMHLDTIFTRVDKNVFAAFKPIIVEGISSNVIVYRKTSEKIIYSSIKEYIINEINKDAKFVLSGNGISPYQEREQWTDGCNLIAVKPGVAITYDRNTRTADAFKDCGFSVISDKKFFEEIKLGNITPDTLEKTIITIKSGELSRARGGGHCMTCPINRA